MTLNIFDDSTVAAHSFDLFNFFDHFRAGNKGFAYTFITKEQERFSGDIVRALESSGVEVPSELDTMWVRYRAKQAAVGLLFISYNR